LNSSVSEDVQVIGRRAREASVGAGDDAAGCDAQRRVLAADDAVSIRLDEAVDV
jgi:hypothetical protein